MAWHYFICCWALSQSKQARANSCVTSARNSIEFYSCWRATKTLKSTFFHFKYFFEHKSAMSDFHLWQLEKIKKTRKANPEPMEIEPGSQGKDPNQQKKEEEYATLVKRYVLNQFLFSEFFSASLTRSRIITKYLKKYSYFNQLTNGCGKADCINQFCASCVGKLIFKISLELSRDLLQILTH